MFEVGLEAGTLIELVYIRHLLATQRSDAVLRPGVILWNFDLPRAVAGRMGCGNSTAREDSENGGFSRRNTLVEKPNVVVEIGKGVMKIDRERRIVFIFGR